MFQWIENTSNSLIVTLNPNTITLNQNAANYFKDVKYVRVGINCNLNQVAIHPVTKEDLEMNLFDIKQLHRISLGNGYGKITNKSLCQTLQTLTTTPFNNTKYEATYDQNERLLIFTLPKEDNQQ